MIAKRIQTVAYVEWNSRLFGIAQMLIFADNFKEMFAKLEKLYPEVEETDITYYEQITCHDVIK